MRELSDKKLERISFWLIIIIIIKYLSIKKKDQPKSLI